MKSIWMNGKTYGFDQILGDPCTREGRASFENKVIDFIRQWEQGSDEFYFATSGSTGRPKFIKVDRQKMLSSAQGTMDYLHLYSGSCLLCLDPSFIAGAMVIVRALARDMELYALDPSGNPFQKLPDDITIDLCSLVPLQVHEILHDDLSSRKLNNVRHVLIGGSDLSNDLESQIRQFSNCIYHTFGMTETVSHIALRRLNGENPDEYFHALPGVKLAVDHRGCLIISGKITGNTSLITNDRVDLINESQFKWLGRFDHLINSGSIKIAIEPLEKKIESILKEYRIFYPFFIAGVPDNKLGQKISIIFESANPIEGIDQLKGIMKNELQTYEMPKQWRRIHEFIRTSTQKIDRQQSLKQSIGFD